MHVRGCNMHSMASLSTLYSLRPRCRTDVFTDIFIIWFWLYHSLSMRDRLCARSADEVTHQNLFSNNTYIAKCNWLWLMHTLLGGARCTRAIISIPLNNWCASLPIERVSYPIQHLHVIGASCECDGIISMASEMCHTKPYVCTLVCSNAIFSKRKWTRNKK